MEYGDKDKKKPKKKLTNHHIYIDFACILYKSLLPLNEKIYIPLVLTLLNVRC